jgi:hypothetical protein
MSVTTTDTKCPICQTETKNDPIHTLIPEVYDGGTEYYHRACIEEQEFLDEYRELCEEIADLRGALEDAGWNRHDIESFTEREFKEKFAVLVVRYPTYHGQFEMEAVS